MKFGKIMVGLAVFVTAIVALSTFASAMTLEMHEGSMGTGAKYMAVAYGNGTYVEVWYNATGAYLNATAIDANTGIIEKTQTLSTDVYTYNGAPSIKPAIVYDYADGAFVVFWVNSSNYLEGIAIDSELNVVNPEFTVNETYGVSYKGMDAAYGNNTILVVWSDSSKQLVGRFINRTFNGAEFRITQFTSVYQQNPWVGYDNVSKRFMVVWTNVTENSTGTKFYNITGRIIGVGDVNYTGDMIIGNAYATGDSFTAPVVTGGGDCFLVNYVEYGSPYGIISMLYNSKGTLIKNMVISNTYKYGKSPMPAIYNGSVFIMAWSNSSESIVSAPIYTNGTMGMPKVIYNGTNGGNPVMTYSPDNKTYFFSWTEYNKATAYGLSYAVLTTGEYVPELNMVAPIFAALLVGAVVLVRRKH